MPSANAKMPSADVQMASADATMPSADASEKQVPWYVWCSVAAVTFAVVGVHWDISWHKSIGRDTFWTPAHIAIHMCGILAGISCGYLILSTTFSPRSLLRECSVWIWGFRGPLGAFIAAWGGIAMLTSAPFDNWWHNAYGLDVKILSPPHMVLAMGIFAVHAGALILILGQMNRASGNLRKQLQWMFLYVGGMILVILTVIQMEITQRLFMHTAHFYYLVALVAPPVLAGVASASNFKWAATTVAGAYFGMVFLIGRILPMFHAEPKLGPVYHQLDQFTPPEFPLLLIVPAFALDMIWQRTGGWGTLRKSLVSGAVFVAVYAAVQWPFGTFLASPAARNWFFGSKYFGYFVPADSLPARWGFVPTEIGAAFWQQFALAAVTAMVTCWVGLWWGHWMKRVRR
jgi:hypothetical protein